MSFEELFPALEIEVLRLKRRLLFAVHAVCDDENRLKAIEQELKIVELRLAEYEQGPLEDQPMAGISRHARKTEERSRFH